MNNFNLIQSLFSLKGKVAIVTGAGGFFGKAFSECLLFAGAKVVLFGRGPKIRKIAKSLQKRYGKTKVDYCLVDFYKESVYRKCLKETLNKNKTVDILVNNAYEFSQRTGFNHPSGRMENISKQQWMRGLESGIYWYALSAQVVGEKMKQQKNGSIINISSMYALVSPDPKLYEGVSAFNPPSYGVAKAGILALTRYIASFYAKYNIRCNSILPGAFPNLGANSYNSTKDKKFLKRLTEKIPLRRFGNLNDLEGILIFLASDASSYITGQGIVVDGGWTIR